MQPTQCDARSTTSGETFPNHDRASVVLRLLVRNHPGVMSHVCGLFHRRLFNVDGIACVPTADTSRSAVLLLVRDDARLEQVVRQLAKLVDVLEIRRDGTGADAFTPVAAALGCPPPGRRDADAGTPPKTAKTC
jgi:acetolactate synthase-1/3 small subunit